MGGTSKRKKEGRGTGIPSNGDQVRLGEVGKGQKKAALKKKKISMKEVYMDKNQAIIKQKDIKRRTMSYYGRKRRTQTAKQCIYVEMGN